MATWSKQEYFASWFGPKAKDIRIALKNAEQILPHKARSIKIFRLHYRLNSKKETDETIPFSKIAPKFNVSVSGAARMSHDVELLLRRNPELWPK